MEIQNKELHRITTTTLVYKPDFTYLITKRAEHKKSHPRKWTVPGGGLSAGDYIDTPQSEHGENLWYNLIGGVWDEIRQVDEILKKRKKG